MSDTNNGVSKRGIRKFFREAKAELKKVTWPSKSQLIKNTAVIIVFVLIVTVILSALDIGFGKLLQYLTSTFN